MAPPDQSLTAPPSTRTPGGFGQGNGDPRPGPSDPQQPWLSFVQSVQSECQSDPHCMLKEAFSVVGIFTPPCHNTYTDCQSSITSFVSVLYTSLYTVYSASSTIPSPIPTPPPDSTPSNTSPQTSTSTNVGIATSPSTSQVTSSWPSDSKTSLDNTTSTADDFSVSTPSSPSSSAPPPSTSAVSDSNSASTETPGNLPGTPSPKRLSAHASPSGAIAGGVVGALIFLALLAALTLSILRRRRKARLPPSAEFMRMARGGAGGSDIPAFATFDLPDSQIVPTKSIPLARQSSVEDDERPPAFTPGSYSDPIFEKVHASAAMRNHYSNSTDHEEGEKVFEAY